MYKNNGRLYDYLVPRQTLLVATWTECAVNLIGPLKITIHGREVDFKALTTLDSVTNLLEIIQTNDKSSAHVAHQFSSCWLSRYPWSTQVIHDKGGEFIGWEFQNLLRQLSIQSVPTTTVLKNPQSNAIIERLHQTMRDILRVMLHNNPPYDENDANQIVDNVLATCVHSSRCAVNYIMQTSPGALVFQRNMLMNVPLIVNL